MASRGPKGSLLTFRLKEPAATHNPPMVGRSIANPKPACWLLTSGTARVTITPKAPRRGRRYPRTPKPAATPKAPALLSRRPAPRYPSQPAASPFTTLKATPAYLSAVGAFPFFFGASLTAEALSRRLVRSFKAAEALWGRWAGFGEVARLTNSRRCGVGSSGW